MFALKSTRIESSATDVVEVAALRGRAAELASIAEARRVHLPDFGRVGVASDHIVLAVRPQRWLVLSPPARAGVAVQGWRSSCAGVAAAVDLSSALAALEIAGPAVREVLARGCRVDLDPQVFPEGHAAATIMAQVPVILANLGASMLLLTPSTTAQHFREWLVSAARPFGLVP